MDNKRPGQQQMTYYFGKTCTDGQGLSKELLGGKGANLAEMTHIGLPVPPGFTITTSVCGQYYDQGKRIPAGLMGQVKEKVAMLEEELGKKFGDEQNPLLVSVRSGAAVSMPGMMDTILNLGLTDTSVAGLAENTGNPRFAFDAYRRLINMFGGVVMGVEHRKFEDAFDEIKTRHNAVQDTDVPASGLVELCESYQQVYKDDTGQDFPQDPFQQLELAIVAVFKSWNTPRAIRYREVENIRGLLGTGVNVQSMAYGNMGEDSGTGVAFTRDPSTGENIFYGEFLVNAQGEDVVAGIRTPQPVSEMPDWKAKSSPDVGATVYKQLLEIKDILEKHYRDMQDIEFTIERGNLFMLQTRNGKRTGPAAVRVACEMVQEGLIDERTAVKRVPPNDLTQLLLPSFDPEAKKLAEVLAHGLPASPGASVGKLAFTADEAVARTAEGETVLLVRKETSPEDIDGMHSAAGILTSTGGMTSHAAVVARGWGRCCVAGAAKIQINEKARKITIGSESYSHDDTISLDGTTGEVMAGAVATKEPTLSGEFSTLMEWADKYRTLKVRTNADTPRDSQRARDFGAEGIGLCRTEHMFFESDRIGAVRQLILVADVYKQLKSRIDNLEAKPTLESKDRETLDELKEEFEEPRKHFLDALSQLLPYQRRDFVGIFNAMRGLPVTIRLLDPPLHEFLPHDEKSQSDLAKQMGVEPATLKARVEQLHEANPMLGHRGCRLSVTYPEILEMQVRAIVEAAIECQQEHVDVHPEIMIPLVGAASELKLLRELAEKAIGKVKKERGVSEALDILIGTMIEIPRAALTANEVAVHADFFSFGTNDLTQMTFGYSRDDINSFLPEYLKQEILPVDPFQSLDASGVGQLVEMGVAKGRAARNNLKIGICGEHGGDPASIDFFHRAGLDYVSCSPFRVPIARLAAAQAALEQS